MPSPAEDEFELDDDLLEVAATLREVTPADRALETPPESIWTAIASEVEAAAEAAPADVAETEALVREQEASFERERVAAGSGPGTSAGSSQWRGAGEGRTDHDGGADKAAGDDELAPDAEALFAAYEATRSMLRAKSIAELSAALVDLVERLGGHVGPAEVERDAVMPVDLSLGSGAPLLPRAEPMSLARMRLEAVLPTLVEDARHVLTLLEGSSDPD